MARNRPSPPPEHSPNRRLRDHGLLPVKWAGTVNRLRRAGVQVEKHPEAFVSARPIPGQRQEPAVEWAPRWAVLVAEADPCAEEARDWALDRAANDEDFKLALETIAALGGDRFKMAGFVMAQWVET